MIKRILPIALLSAAMISNTGCGNKGNGDFKHINGVSYKIVKDVPGKNAKFGDIVEFNILVKCDTAPGQAAIIAGLKKTRPAIRKSRR